MDPLTANAFVIIAILVIFFVIGSLSFKSRSSLGRFFLIGRTLETEGYAKSFTASSTSLATCLFFFVQFGGSNGLYILFAPLTYFGGVLGYTLLLKGLTRDHYSETGTTLADYMKQKFNSPVIAWTIRLITCCGLLAILLIEFYVGVTILKIYTGPLAEPLGLTALALLVTGYTLLGGFRGVLRTDRLQFWIMVIATIVLAGWLGYLTRTQNFKDLLLPYPALQTTGPLLPWPLFLNIIAVNAFLIPTHLRTWQMAAASKNIRDVKHGIISGGIWTALLWGGFTIIGIQFVALQPGTESNVHNLLNMLKESTSWFSMYIAFPLIFCGCISAMVSTADSAMLPLLYEIVYPFSRKFIHRKNVDSNQDNQKTSEDKLPAYTWPLLAAALGVFVIILVGYHIVIIRLGYNFNELLFTLFSLLIVTGPTVVTGTLWPRFACSFWGRKAAFLSMAGGIILALTISYSGVQQKDIGIVQYGGPLSVAWAISIICLGGVCYGVCYLIRGNRS